jgi:hypothetical protein
MTTRPAVTGQRPVTGQAGGLAVIGAGVARTGTRPSSSAWSTCSARRVMT